MVQCQNVLFASTIKAVLYVVAAVHMGRCVYMLMQCYVSVLLKVLVCPCNIHALAVTIPVFI